MRLQVHFLGGNGHCAVRLEAAREVLSRTQEAFTLVSVPYPGFEGRSSVATFNAFLDSLTDYFRGVSGEGNLVYGMGIGGLLALCLRARGELLSTPLLLQGPVLWGLERRWMPRLMRIEPFQRKLHSLFQTATFQDRFLRRYFERPVSAEIRQKFFAGYAECTALPDLFRWLNPNLLRELEQAFKTYPNRLKDLLVWLGDRDRVVGMNEVLWTREALGAWINVGTLPGWGHYPMMDDPEDWVRTLAGVGTGMCEGSTYENR